VEKLFIFIDESGLTSVKSGQRYLIVVSALMRNRAFAEELISEIRSECKRKGKPIENKELKFHKLLPLQKEIAIRVLNSHYKNFYICFIDLARVHSSIASGAYEFQIQTTMIKNLLFNLDKDYLRKFDAINVIMDKKLSSVFQNFLKNAFQSYIGTKKGVLVKTSSSARERGIQIADLIAGAFRAKLMRKSDLFEVDLRRVFQVTIPDVDVFKTEKL